MMSTMAEKPEIDIWRDTYVRYLGYANEVGESFRSVVPVKVVRLAYAVAFAYVFADTFDKSWKSYKKGDEREKVVKEAGDALIWQTLASVIIPGYTINRLCAITNGSLIRYAPKMPFTIRNVFTISAGLLSIPLIVHPIDRGTDILMDETYRKWSKA